MIKHNTQGVILRRTNYGEADRIISFITSEFGKQSLIAKGVRKSKSKLAGGIEFFSVSDISFIEGKHSLGTLISTRLIKHYHNIVKDIDRTMLGYEMLKQLDSSTEDRLGSEYFDLLRYLFAALDDPAIKLDLVREWFIMQLLKLDGHTPNLLTDDQGINLIEETRYNFDIDTMTFQHSALGKFSAKHIKLLRLGFGDNNPGSLQRITDIDSLIVDILPLAQAMRDVYIRL
ncbi:MAG TPA: DNA repair protein RecO [Candidatus Saccharimonadales bacterium]|nr:DNA repair protein RecO [Candidatus Saccharimonadales bacterium]